MFSGFIQQVDGPLFQGEGRAEQMGNGLAVVCPELAVIGKVMVVQQGVRRFKREETVVIHVQQSLRNGVEIHGAGKRPGVVMNVTKVVGNVYALQLAADIGDILILTNGAGSGVDVAVGGVPTGGQQRMVDEVQEGVQGLACGEI